MQLPGCPEAIGFRQGVLRVHHLPRAIDYPEPAFRIIVAHGRVAARFKPVGDHASILAIRDPDLKIATGFALNAHQRGGVGIAYAV